MMFSKKMQRFLESSRKLALFIPTIIIPFLYPESLEVIILYSIVVFLILTVQYSLPYILKTFLIHKQIVSATALMGFRRIPRQESQLNQLLSNHIFIKEADLYFSGNYRGQEMGLFFYSFPSEPDNAERQGYYVGITIPMKKTFPKILISDKHGYFSPLFNINNHQLEAVEFNKQFSIYAADPRLALEVLEPSTMTRLLDIKAHDQRCYDYFLLDNTLLVFTHSNEARVVKTMSIEFSLMEALMFTPSLVNNIYLQEIIEKSIKHLLDVADRAGFDR